MYDLTIPVITHKEPINRRERRAAEKEIEKKLNDIAQLAELFGIEIIEDRTPDWDYDRLYQAYKGVYIRLMRQINQKSRFTVGNTRFFENTFKPVEGSHYYTPGWYHPLLRLLRNGIQA